MYRVYQREDRQMKKPVILLKSIYLHVGLSDETPAYTARLFVDGEHFADVSNSGHGGCDMVYPPKDVKRQGFYDRAKALKARIAATYPGHDFDAGGTEHHLQESLEGLCHTQAWESVEKRNFKSQLSRKVMMVEDGKIYSIKGKKTSERIMAVAKRYPDATILNSLKFDAAYNLFKEHAA